MRWLLSGLWIASILLMSIVNANAAQNPDAVACDNNDPKIRIAGCSRLLSSGKLAKQHLWLGYWQRGQGYNLAKRYDEAIADYSKSISLKASSIVYSDRGAAHFEKKELDEAMRDFSKAIDIDPKNDLAYFGKGNVYLLRNDFDTALKFVNMALEKKQQSKFYNMRGLVWVAKKDNDRALVDYDNSIRIDPKNIDPLVNICSLYSGTGEVDRALSYCDQALRLDAASVNALNNRAIIWTRKKQYDKALGDIDKSISIDPKNANNYRTRGFVFSLMDQFDRAIGDFDAALRIDPNELTGYLGRGDALRKKGDLDKALLDFSTLVTRFPTKPEGYYGRAMIAVTQGNFDQAFADYAKVLEIDPNNASAYADRGEAYEKIRDYDKARKDFQRAVEMPSFRYIETNGLLNRSADYRREQDTAKARLAVLEGAATGAPPPKPAAAPAVPSKADASDPGRRIALVIGNGAYKNATPLPNPPNDARGIAKNLRDIGFEVSEGIDLEKAKLQSTIVGFLRDAASANLALVFYAGHGMQIDGKNYLVPVDAAFDGSTDLATTMTDMDTILAALDGKLRTNIIILDACRDNPMAKPAVVASAEPSRSVRVRSGLAAPSNVGSGAMAGAGTMIAFATAPGQVALDGDGSNSPFSTALIRHVGTPGLEVQQMMTRVRADVVASTKGKQVPWSNSALIGEVFLTAK